MQQINGNTSGIKDVVLDRLKECYDLKSRNQIVSGEMAGLISKISWEINKEICVMLSRDGSVLDVSIGDSNTVKLKSFNTTRSDKGLCGVRCIHTHPGGSGMLSSVDIGSLQSVKYDAMVALGVSDGKVTDISVGILDNKDEEGISHNIYGMFKLGAMPDDGLFDRIRDAIVLGRGEDYVEEQERAILIGIDAGLQYDSLKELERLCENADLNVVEAVSQKRDKADNGYYVGKGKLEDISLLCSAKRVDVAVCDDELSSHQLRNLEDILGIKIIDRTMLILSIFAKRATTSEGKLQVELAQQKYRLPRLYGMGRIMSRLGAGIGTRGPGEKKLEIDQRHIKKRIGDLEKSIGELESQRQLRRKSIVENQVPVVALVGYTNAGKSSLLKRISGSDTYIENQLFATLDPVTRKVSGELDFLLSDTVGFINKLPHDLVSAFKSTLEQAKYANLILHVIDSSSDYATTQIEVVDRILEDLNIVDVPVLRVYNKWDETILTEQDIPRDSICVSAKTGEGIEQLLIAVKDKLRSDYVQVEVVIPYSKGGLQQIVRKGIVEQEEYRDDGIYFSAKLKSADADQLANELRR